MTRKRSKPKLGASLTAKFAAEARATFHRKKIVTEIIPPDVTRAKVGRWLDLISPITEWAGLKGDALWYRRQQLRIQQESALDALAKMVCTKMTGRKVVQPLPPKILVPALEAASLEDPESPLIEWWANILVSGATGMSVRPYHIDLMKVIGPEEASCLNAIWRDFSRVDEYVHGNMDAGMNIVHRLKGWFEPELSRLEKRTFTTEDYRKDFMDILNRLQDQAAEVGVPVSLSIIERSSKSSPIHSFTYSIVPNLLRNKIAVDVCLALNLLKVHEDTIDLDFARYQIKAPDKFEPAIGVTVVYPSALGTEFMLACTQTKKPRAGKGTRKRA
jgi:hypothetical protein